MLCDVKNIKIFKNYIITFIIKYYKIHIKYNYLKLHFFLYYKLNS
jgi:hypothetical protein